VPFVGAAPALLLTEDDANYHWDAALKKLGLRHALPTRDLHVKNDTGSGALTALPTVSVENAHVGVFGTDFSFASFEMTAQNRAMIGEFFADGIGALNPNATGTSGTPCLMFRTFTAHPIVRATNGVRREHLGATGNWTLGLREGDAFHQIGLKALNEVYNLAARAKVHGASLQSMSEEVMLRWVRNENGAQYWPGSADWKLSSVGPGGAPSYGRYTKLVLALKGAASYNEGADVDVLDLRAGPTAGGEVTVKGALMVGTSGTLITQSRVYLPNLTPAAIGAAGLTEETFAVAGLTTADTITLNPPAPTANVSPVAWRVSAADTLAITWLATAAATPTAGIYRVKADRS
jgi:hypothetical protein